MEFYLTYQGSLPSNGSPVEKHIIRKVFHDQLKILWEMPPLVESKQEFLSEIDDSAHIDILKKRGGIKFAPLICNKLHLYAILEITLLWPDKPGSIINTGDIDNRLKTLFDALSLPDENQIKQVLKNEPYEDIKNSIFYCLLEDDKLIQSVNIKTHTWLSSNTTPDILSVIRVNIKANRQIFANIGIGD